MDAHDNRIKCNVDSCGYWGQGNQCLAREILVDNTRRGGTGRGDMEIGRIGEGRGEAGTSDDTCCETFVPRGQGRRRNQMRTEELER
jgi:hypothetical protein